MKNILRIYKIMIHHWGFMVVGLFFMFGFAIFSGVSITMAIPLFDNVFSSSEKTIEIDNYHDFLEKTSLTISNYTKESESFSDLWSEESLSQLKTGFDQVLSQTDPKLLLWIISAAIIILVLLKNIFFYGNKVMFANLRGRSIQDIRSLMFSKYLYQSLSFYSTNKTGDALVRMVSDVKIVSNLFIGSVFRMLQDFVLLLVNIIIVLLINPKLFLISLVIFPALSITVSYLGKKIKKYSKRLQNQSSELFSYVEETLSSMKIVKAFAREEMEQNEFDKQNKRYIKFWLKSILYTAFNTPISEVLSTLMGIIVLIIGGKQVLAPGSNFTYGYFITFLAALFSMVHPLKKMTQAYANIKKAVVSLDRISVILDRKSEIVESKNAIIKEHFENNILIENVNFSYNETKIVLSDINLEIHKGQQVALVGSSGSGKTTLVNLLTRMYDKTSGSIKIDDIPIEDIKIKNLRRLFGTVTQESILFSDTIKNNITYGTLKQTSDKKIQEAAKIAYADEFIEQFPNKYDQMMDIKASNLSGGQKQRLCIARAIIGNPPILIFDEATSALDSEAEQKVQLAIEQATKNRTVIVIAHRLSTILSSDKIVVMDKGKIVGIGKHHKLIKTCARYKLLYDLQFTKDDTI